MLRRWSSKRSGTSEKSEPSPVSPDAPWQSTPPTSAHSNNEPSPRTPSTGTFPTRMFGHKGEYGFGEARPTTPHQIEEPPIAPPTMGRSQALRLSKRAELLDKRVNVHFRRDSNSPYYAANQVLPPSPQHVNHISQHSAHQTPRHAPAHVSQMYRRMHPRSQPPPQPQSQPEAYRGYDPFTTMSARSLNHIPLQPMPPLLEETIPARHSVHELEGGGPAGRELEGSTPGQALTAVPARVIAAGAVKAVTIKARAKRASLVIMDKFKPPRTRYDVQCANAAEDVARMDREAKEKLHFAFQINGCRKDSNRAPFEINDELCAHAQHHADNMLSASDFAPPNSPTFYLPPPPPANVQQPETVASAASPLDPLRTVTRIISERNIGGLACVERWNGGQYRRHVTPVDPERHQLDCQTCKLVNVFEAIMDERFTKIGVGRAMENGSGVWVVELAE